MSTSSTSRRKCPTQRIPSVDFKAYRTLGAAAPRYSSLTARLFVNFRTSTPRHQHYRVPVQRDLVVAVQFDSAVFFDVVLFPSLLAGATTINQSLTIAMCLLACRECSRLTPLRRILIRRLMLSEVQT